MTTTRIPSSTLLVGGGLGGAFPTGRTLDFAQSKFSSLLMTLADRMG